VANSLAVFALPDGFALANFDGGRGTFGIAARPNVALSSMIVE